MDERGHQPQDDAEFDRLAWESYKELAAKAEGRAGQGIVFALTKHHAPGSVIT